MRLIFVIASAFILPVTAPLQAAAFGPNDTYPDIDHSTPLSEAELTEVFKGKTHLGSYNFLSKNITTYAFEETTKDDGSIRHVQEDVVDTGTWSISGNEICYDYDAPSLLQACFKIYARGNCYYHYQVSTEGFAQYGFTARTVIAGETPKCEPGYV